jgi:hypothetical protein
MHTPQDWGAIRDIAQAQDKVFTTGGRLKEAMHGEFCKWGRQLGGGYKYDGHRVLLISMGLEIRKAGIVTARSYRRLCRIVVHTDREVRSMSSNNAAILVPVGVSLLAMVFAPRQIIA